MSSLVDVLARQLSGNTAAQIGKQLGVDETTVKQGVDVALPLLVAALARNTSSPEGAQALSNALARDHDGSVLNNVPQAVDTYQSGSGEKILGHVFGDQLGQIETTLNQSTGMDAAELLKILAPLVLGYLGKKQRQEGLDPGGLAGTLQQEQKQIESSNSEIMNLITQLLDRNKDGSIIDEVIGFIGKLFSQKK